MKTYRFLSILLILVFAEGCVSFKKGLIHSGGIDDAIQNAILDFSNTANLYKKDSVFSVSVLEIVNQDPLVVRIGKSTTKLLFTKETKIGCIDCKIPTRFIEKNDKIFFWWDKDYPLTKEALDAYAKYNLLQDDEGGIITVPDFVVDESQKAVHYYFCKTNLSKYKKVITSKGVGYYEPPKLKCEE